MSKEKNSKENLKSEEIKNKDSFNKQVGWVFGVAVGLVLTYLIVSSAISSFRSFEYEGLTFTREKFEQLQLFRYSYNTAVPITGRVSGNPTTPRKVDLYLRVDPRTNKVPFEGDEIDFQGRTIYIAIGEGIESCEYASVGSASLSSFLTQNGFKIRAVFLDKQKAEENNGEFSSCEHDPDKPVIEIKLGEETKVSSLGNCYEIEIANCEVIPAIEKFEVQSVLDAKERLG